LHLFFSNLTLPTDISTLSLHDALPILNIPHASLLLFRPGPHWSSAAFFVRFFLVCFDDLSGKEPHLLDATNGFVLAGHLESAPGDRKSTRLNSSHLVISYAVFCLKKKR